MATVNRSTRAGLDANQGKRAPIVSGDVYAGEDLPAAAFCYIKSDGKVYNCDATAAGETTRLAGVTGAAYKAGEAVTLFGIGTRLRYADSGLTPGAPLYLDVTANKGGLSNTATTGDAVGVAAAINATDIRVTRNI
ncbi:MAG TPA: hypothetical protein VHN99_06840 [Deinococcales bacterium]|nr:hypothetical protein [Deinococcales bacterium]